MLSIIVMPEINYVKNLINALVQLPDVFCENRTEEDVQDALHGRSHLATSNIKLTIQHSENGIHITNYSGVGKVTVTTTSNENVTLSFSVNCQLFKVERSQANGYMDHAMKIINFFKEQEAP